MKVAVDIIKVNKFSQTMFSWDMPKWAYDNMRIEQNDANYKAILFYIILYYCYKLSVILFDIIKG